LEATGSGGDEILRRVRVDRERHASKLAAEYAEAVGRLQEQLRAGSTDPAPYCKLARWHARADDHDQAIAACRLGLERIPDDVTLLLALARLLQETGDARAAISLLEGVGEPRRNDPVLLMADALMLPVLYDSEDDIAWWRRRFESGLERLEGAVDCAVLLGQEALDPWVSAIAPPFLLACQGVENLDLQVRFGRLVRGIMEARFPAYGASIGEDHEEPGGRKLRVGYLSARLFWGSVAKVGLGWVTHHDRNRFEVYCYHLGDKTDPTTRKFERHSDVFRHLTDTFASTCERIATDRLDVLVLLDVGMDPVMTRLAGLRLARVQCATCCHPVTTGSPCIDFFLSGELFEPDGASSSYSEKLIRLPHMGASLAKPAVPKALLTLQRRDFGLEEGAFLFLCCQPTWKYLPHHDWIFPAIAERVPSCRFVFTPQNTRVGDRLLARIGRSFSRAGLDGKRFCLRPYREHRFADQYMTPLEFWNLCKVCDAFLDTIGWSGYVSAMEASACGLPVVTLSDGPARGRQAAAVLQRAGIEATTGADVQGVVDIAVRLADPASADEKRAACTARLSRVFDDSTCVRALERFYLSAGGW